MFNSLSIESSNGAYSVEFAPNLLEEMERIQDRASVYIVDQRVMELYGSQLGQFLNSENSIPIVATEENKSIENIIPIIEQLIALGLKRNNSLVAIGGGIIQDITCFIASVLFRGVPWKFVPTTLLSQADSCIGSKSSVNLPSLKNALGTFKPPQNIWICPQFLDSLNPVEIKSGIGEIIKVHAIDGQASFQCLADEFEKLEADRDVLLKYIRAALEIKKRYIEVDEFDRNERNIFNYGHSFGHAIEAATNFGIPHGIAVSIGMDMANTIAADRGLTSITQRDRMRPVMRKNFETFRSMSIPFDPFIEALKKDKKNTDTDLVLILPCGEDAEIRKVKVPLDDSFIDQCANFFFEVSDAKH